MLICENEIFNFIKQKIEADQFEFEIENLFGVEMPRPNKIYIQVPCKSWWRKTRKSLVQFCDEYIYFQGFRVYHPDYLRLKTLLANKHLKLKDREKEVRETKRKLGLQEIADNLGLICKE